MKLFPRWLLTIYSVAVLKFPAFAQNTGGLPGTEHTQAFQAFRQAERVVVYGDIVHCAFEITVGPGVFDRIRTFVDLLSLSRHLLELDWGNY